MTFTLVHSLFAWLLPLASLPILFHLFFRIKKRPRPFPTLMFFHRIDPRLSARRKILEWIILALRTLLIFFLLLALARPVWFGAGRTGSVAMVILLDNSGSMTGKANRDQTKLQTAVAAADALLASLKPEDKAALVLLVDDPSVPLPAGLVSDQAALRAAAAHIKETEATGTAGAAMHRAIALLENSVATHYEIHVLTDLQEAEWNRSADLKTPRAGTLTFVHRITTLEDRDANVSVLGAQMPARKILAGRRFPLAVSLGNATDTDARGRVNWADDSGNKGLVEVTVPKHGESSAFLVLEPPAPGWHWITVWYEGDSFLADNRLSLAFVCADRRRVMFVGRETLQNLDANRGPETGRDAFHRVPVVGPKVTDGVESVPTDPKGRFMGSGAGVSSAKRLAGEMPALLSDEFGTLPIAVSPGGDGKLSGLVPVFVEPRALTVSLFEKRPALVVTTWESPALRDPALRNFVEAGGNLLIVPVTTGAGASAAPASWLGASVERMEKSDTGSPLLAFKKEAVVFADLRNEKGDVILRNIKAFKFQPLKLAEESGALLGLEDGRALMAEKHLGKGVIFTSGLAMDSSWTTLPLKAGFLALAQNMALAGGDPAEMFISLVAGDTPRAAVHGNDLIQIQTVTGSPLDWRGESANLPALPRSGVYAVRAGTNATYVSVRGSDKEGQRKFLGEDRVAALGSLSHTVKSFSDAEAMASLARKTQVATELFLPLLLLALACLAAEGWLANQPPQKPNLAKAKPTPAAEPSAAVIK